MPVFFTLFVIMSICIYFKIAITQKRQNEAHSLYLQHEKQSYNIKNKDISHLAYITIPNNLPLKPTTDKTLNDLQQKLALLSTKKILNLTGYTNTDLRFMYGTDNIDFLCECDMNFIKLSNLLHHLGNYLHETGNVQEAKTVYEYAVSIKVDISTIYLSLSNIYILDGTPQKIYSLINTARELKSLSCNNIPDILTNKLVTN